MRVCIVGVNGLLGQNLLRTAPAGMELIGTGIEKSPLVSSLAPEAYRSIDIADFPLLERELQQIDADWVINAAAMTAVDLCETEQQQCARINTLAPEVMARASRRLLHLSTDYVFDGVAGPYSETDRVKPLSVYGRSKLESEEKVFAVSPRHLVVRTMTLYGVGAGLRPSFVDWIRTNLSAGTAIRVVTDQIGNPTLASDLAENIWALIAADASGLFHCSGGERCSRYDWARRVALGCNLPTDLLLRTTTPELRQPALRPLQSGFLLDKIAKIPQVRIDGIDSQLRRYFEDLNRVHN